MAHSGGWASNIFTGYLFYSVLPWHLPSPFPLMFPVSPKSTACPWVLVSGLSLGKPKRSNISAEIFSLLSDLKCPREWLKLPTLLSALIFFPSSPRICQTTEKVSIKDPQPKNREDSSGSVMKSTNQLCKGQPHFPTGTALGRQTQNSGFTAHLHSPGQSSWVALPKKRCSHDEDRQAIRFLFSPNFSRNTEVLFLTLRGGVAMVTQGTPRAIWLIDDVVMKEDWHERQWGEKSPSFITLGWVYRSWLWDTNSIWYLSIPMQKETQMFSYSGPQSKMGKKETSELTIREGSWSH